MALDNLVLERIIEEMNDVLSGAFLDAPYALGINQYAIPFHGANKLKEKGENSRGEIILFLDPTKPFISYSLEKFTKTTDNTPFFNSLKKLAGTKIETIFKETGERVVTLRTKLINKELGELNDSFDLIIELFPSRPNAYLVAYPYGKIISLFKERGDILSKRYFTRNVPYSYPPTRPVFGIKTKSLEEAKPLLSYEIFRKLTALSEKEGFEKARDEVMNSSSLYYFNETVYPYVFDLKDAKKIDVKGIYDCYVEDQRGLAKQLREKDLIDKLNKAIKLVKKKIKNLKEDYELSNKHLVYKDYGNLLFLHQTEYVPGSNKIECDGTVVPLNPDKGIIDNANNYFKLYRKAKQAVVTLKELELKAEDELVYLQKKLQEVPLAGNRDLLELKEELVLEGYLKDPSRRNKKIVKKKSYAPHILILPNGDRIGFGMNDLQNETLTFQVANNHDLFFHVKDYPGSHVVILDGRQNDEDKLYAAELALFLSSLDSGDVMVTLKKNVKRNPNKMGLVNILKYETIHVRNIREESLKLFKKAIQS